MSLFSSALRFSIGSALDNCDCNMKKYIDICHSEVSIEGQLNEWRALWRL